MADEHPTNRPARLFEGIVARDFYPLDHRSWERGWAIPVGAAIGAIIGTFRSKARHNDAAETTDD